MSLRLCGSVSRRVSYSAMSRAAGVLGLDDALFLLQRNGLLLVPQNITIRTFAAFQRAIAAFVHRLARGQVFQSLAQIAVVGILAQQVNQDFFAAIVFALADIARLRECVGKINRQVPGPWASF